MILDDDKDKEPEPNDGPNPDLGDEVIKGADCDTRE